LLLKHFNTCFSLFLQLLSRKRNIDIFKHDSLEFSHFLLVHLMHHFLLCMVSFTRQLLFGLLVLRLFHTKLVIVLLKNTVKLCSLAMGFSPDLLSMLLDICHVLFAAHFINQVLFRNTVLLCFKCSLFISDIFLFTFSSRICEFRMFICNLNLFLESLLFNFELTNTIFNQKLFHLLLLKLKLLREFSWCVHIGNVFRIFGVEMVGSQWANTKWMSFEMLLRQISIVPTLRYLVNLTYCDSW